ncbi:hypothetical protein HanRHA438_Chr17g0824751 [Helianthus annuus]|nr:hypothetical protein HanRHA438_Chr17g0824751 [Helianthus annuus]
MILLHKLTKILYVNISLLHFISGISQKFQKDFQCVLAKNLKNSKRFSITDIEVLIFKIPSAEHDEQVWESLIEKFFFRKMKFIVKMIKIFSDYILLVGESVLVHTMLKL